MAFDEEDETEITEDEFLDSALSSEAGKQRLAQAYREGAEAMREACFRAVAGKTMVLPSPIGPLHNIGWNQSNACALETIKAIPIPVKP